MALLDSILGGILSPVKDIIGEFVTDPDKKLEASIKIRELEDQVYARYHDEMMGQMEVNKVEAANSSVFVSGWRPFVGWVGGVGLAYSSILQPFFNWMSRIWGYTGELPVIDSTSLITVLCGMLGIGVMRSFEKYNGVSTEAVGQPIKPVNTTVEVNTEKGAVSVETAPATGQSVVKKKKKFHIF